MIIRKLILVLAALLFVLLLQRFSYAQTWATTTQKFDAPIPTCPYRFYPDLNSCDDSRYDGCLIFPETPVGSWAQPNNTFCLDNNTYTPPQCQCLLNGTGTSWGNVTGSCDIRTPPTEYSQELWDLQNDDNATEVLNILRHLTEIFEETHQVQPYEIRLIANLLDKFADDPANNGDDFVSIINNVMGFDEEALKESQFELNATDMILYSLDKFLINTQNEINYTRNNIVMRSLSLLDDDNIQGFMLLDSNSIIPLYNNINATEIIVNTLNLKFALLLNSAGGNSKSSFVASISEFYNSNLFIAQNQNINSNIFSILFSQSINLQLFFKQPYNYKDYSCSYWQYGKNSEQVAIYGSWYNESLASSISNDIFQCNFNHTTHFGLLLPNSLPDTAILNYITIFGSVLSIMGLLIIIMCGILFKNWRKENRNKIVLSLALSQILLIVLIFVSDYANSGVNCVVIGAGLHYVILANFAWMLVITYFEYRRDCMDKDDIKDSTDFNIWFVKASFISWGSPILFVGFTMASDYENYDKKNDDGNELCYPKDLYFQLTILLPMVCVMTLNLLLYGLIIKKSAISVNFLERQKKINTNHVKANDIKARMRLRIRTIKKSAVFMFFVTGLTWIFGIVGAFSKEAIVAEIFSYLFCFVAVFQGFIIFVHYVYHSKTYKTLWNRTSNLFSCSCGSRCKRNNKKDSINADNKPKLSDASFISES